MSRSRPGRRRPERPLNSSTPRGQEVREADYRDMVVERAGGLGLAAHQPRRRAGVVDGLVRHAKHLRAGLDGAGDQQRGGWQRAAKCEHDQHVALADADRILGDRFSRRGKQDTGLEHAEHLPAQVGGEGVVVTETRDPHAAGRDHRMGDAVQHIFGQPGVGLGQVLHAEFEMRAQRACRLALCPEKQQRRSRFLFEPDLSPSVPVALIFQFPDEPGDSGVGHTGRGGEFGCRVRRQFARKVEQELGKPTLGRR